MEQGTDKQRLKQLRHPSQKERAQAYKRRAERRIKALESRKEGKSYEAIAVELGVSRSQVRKDVEAALAPINGYEREMASALRQAESQRLDWAAEVIKPQVADGNLRAVDRWIRVSAQRARLLGLELQPEIGGSAGKDGVVTVQVRYVDDVEP